VQTLKVSDLPNKIKLVVIHGTLNFAGALTVLVDNKILSAPVLNTQGVIIGQVDLIDLVVFLVHLAKKSQEVLIALGIVGEHEQIDFSDVHVDQQLQQLIKSYDGSQAISNFSQRNPIKTVGADQPLVDIATQLVTNHRVCVVNSANSVINYITQSDFIKFVMKHKEIYSDKANKTVQELQIGNSNVISVHHYDRLIEAFKLIARNGISAVAVINSEGKLVGNVTAHDIKYANPGTDGFVESLILVISNFLSQTQNRPEHVVVSPNTTLEELISTLEAKSVHRVFLTQNDKPIGIISLGDVIKCLLQSVK